MNFGSHVVVDFTLDYGYDIAFCNECGTEPDLDALQKQAITTGLSFAHCGDVVFQVVQCHEPGCTGRIVLRSKADSPVLDMQGMILMPNLPIINSAEQAEILTEYESWPDKLHFKFRQAWDDEYISKQEFVDYGISLKERVLSPGKTIPTENYFKIRTERQFFDQLEKERSQEEYLLKRLYPDNELYRALFALISPRLKTSYYPDPNLSASDQRQRISALYLVLNHYNSESLHKKIKAKLRQHDIFPKQKSEIKNLLYEINSKVSLVVHTRGFQSVYKSILTNDCEGIKAVFIAIFFDIYHPICTDHFLQKRRKELSVWTIYDKKGTALFVDAPMGLGKTFSIVEGLASKPELSAVIFMPTKRLCKEIQNELVCKIALAKGEPPKPDDKIHLTTDEIQAKLENNEEIVEQYKGEFIARQGVYLYDGINKEECRFYKDIIGRYKKFIYSKKTLCSQCEEKDTCRFLTHRYNAYKFRIIIATHAMYDQIFNAIGLFKWKKKESFVERDFMIVDEDIIFSKCYQPISMNDDDIRDFIATFTNFLNDPDYFKDNPVDKDVFFKLDSILAQYMKCGTTSYIPPIDPNFTLSRYIKKQWDDSQDERSEMTPDFLPESKLVFDYLELVESIIRKGFVVQKYDLLNTNTFIRQAYFPNPKVFKFGKNTPAHIFFDGTKLDDEFVRAKLLNVKIEKLEIPIKDTLWTVDAWQNLNTNLPKSKASKNKDKVQNLISQMINEIGIQKKYFILSSKSLRVEIEEWTKNTFPGVYIVFEHYGNLRGMNTAKECNVGIVLGSFLLSDAVEIAMSIDFFYKEFEAKNPVPIATINKFWTWQGNKGERRYKEPYEMIQEFSNKYRYAEYRQALARTRYLFHPTSFYLFSKDKIEDYEPFVKEVKSYHFKEDIFPPLPKWAGATEETIENNIFKWLETNPTVSATDIHQCFKLRRQTVAKHLNRMFKEGMLRQAPDYKKRYQL